MNYPTIKLSKLKPHPKNPRTHSPEQVEKIARSIKELGWGRPIIISTDYYILAGHGAWEAAERLGYEEVPYRMMTHQHDSPEALAYMVADNKLTDESSWNYADLELVFEDIKLEGFEIELTGFQDTEVNEVSEKVHGPTEVVEDDYDPDMEVETVVQLGQIWKLGQHRLMCGDSTKKEDVDLLMDGNLADMVFTDPPYGIGEDIENDNLNAEELSQWNYEWIKNIPNKIDCPFVSYHSTKTFPSLLLPAINNGWVFERALWFHRPDKFPVHTWNSWMLTSQIILLFSKGTPNYIKVSPANQDYYKNTSKDLKKHYGHPTQKIVSHLSNVLIHFDSINIYEPFGGSGSTLIACEQLNRSCYMMELDPHYCDVIIDRWETFTGQKAELIS